MKLRILTLLMYGLVTLLIVRFVEMMDQHFSGDSSVLGATALFAEESKEEKPKEENKEKKEESDKKDEKKEEPKDKEDKKDDKESGDKKNETKDGEAKESETKEGGISDEPPQEAKLPTFTPTEIEILQRLSYRRGELDEWQKELELKEKVMNITQTKIDQKLDELRVLKKEVEAVLAQYNAKEDEKVTGLVRIYEKMKPKAAADIFSQLENSILVGVARKMKGPTLAPIMAAMDPKKAKELTEELAKFNALADRTPSTANNTSSSQNP